MQLDLSWVIIGAIWGYAIGQLLVLVSVVFWDVKGAYLWFRFRSWLGLRRRARWAAKHPEEAEALRRRWEPVRREVAEALRAYQDAQAAFTVEQAEANIADARRDL